MRYLIISLILLSCNAEKRCQSHLNKAKLGGCLVEEVKHDTTYQIDIIKGDEIVTYDTAIDTLYLKDTCYSKERIKYIVQKLKIEPITVNDSNVDLKIWLDSGKIKYNVKPKTKTITKTDKQIVKEIEYETPSYIKWLIAALVIALIIALLKK